MDRKKERKNQFNAKVKKPLSWSVTEDIITLTFKNYRLEKTSLQELGEKIVIIISSPDNSKICSFIKGVLRQNIEKFLKKLIWEKLGICQIKN